MLPIGALLVGSFLKSSTLETQLRLKIKRKVLTSAYPADKPVRFMQS
jgi:hypothetical protein